MEEGCGRIDDQEDSKILTSANAELPVRVLGQQLEPP
jgi:hypothetical protein